MIGQDVALFSFTGGLEASCAVIGGLIGHVGGVWGRGRLWREGGGVVGGVTGGVTLRPQGGGAWGVNVPLGSGDAVAAAMSVSPAGENSSLDEYAIWSVRTMLHNQEIT